jgi:hypothetical protein
VTGAQLLAAGVRESAIERALRAGRLHRLHRGVYSIPAPELLTESAHLTAALLAAGKGAMLACGTRVALADDRRAAGRDRARGAATANA